MQLCWKNYHENMSPYLARPGKKVWLKGFVTKRSPSPVIIDQVDGRLMYRLKRTNISFSYFVHPLTKAGQRKKFPNVIVKWTNAPFYNRHIKRRGHVGHSVEFGIDLFDTKKEAFAATIDWYFSYKVYNRFKINRI